MAALQSLLVNAVLRPASPGKLCEGGAQELVRVHRRVVNAHFIMQVRPGAAAGESHVADDLALMHRLSIGDGKAGEVSVARGDPAAVLDLNHAAVAVVEVSIADGAVGRRQHRLAEAGGDVDAGVEGALTI